MHMSLCAHVMYQKLFLNLSTSDLPPREVNFSGHSRRIVGIVGIVQG